MDLSFAGKLWFIDLTYGLLACDPFAQDRQLTFVPLPPGCVPLSESFRHTDRDIMYRRCVKVSGGKIRYAMIWCSVKHLLAVDLCSKKLLECQLISMDPSSRSIHAWEVSLPLHQQLEGCGGLLKALGGLTLFAKASNENNQDELSFAPHFLIEIIGRADLTSVIRTASTCRVVRRHILDSLFQRCLTGSFAESLFLGHFQMPWQPLLMSAPYVLKSPFYDIPSARFSAQIEISEREEQADFGDYSPVATSCGYIVFRDKVDPALCIWNPFTKFITLLPEVAGITRRSSCILEILREYLQQSAASTSLC